jgi:hypothetical protein
MVTPGLFPNDVLKVYTSDEVPLEVKGFGDPDKATIVIEYEFDGARLVGQSVSQDIGWGESFHMSTVLLERSPSLEFEAIAENWVPYIP